MQTLNIPTFVHDIANENDDRRTTIFKSSCSNTNTSRKQDLPTDPVPLPPRRPPAPAPPATSRPRTARRRNEAPKGG